MQEFSIARRPTGTVAGNAVSEASSIVIERRGQTYWRIAQNFAPVLDDVLRASATVVKQSNAKLVSAHDIAGRRYYVKRYRHEAFAMRPLKFFFKSSQARQEWDLAQELSRRGIPLVRHVALGERWSARGLLESILITEGFDGVPLDEAAEVDTSAVILFVRRVAEAHAIHADLHPANLLVNARGELVLVDLHGMRIAERTSPGLLEDEMLAQLRVTLPLPVSEAVNRMARAKRLAAFASRARRCLKTNRDFARKKFGALRWHVRLSALDATLEGVLRDPDGFLARARSLKAGRSSTVGAASSLVLKRFNFRRWLRPLKDIFRQSRARAAFVKAYHLELCGVPTARVFAAADERVLGLVWRGFVVMEEIPGAVVLPTWPGNERIAARQVGALIAKLHNEGFAHRDLKETNIVFDAKGKPHLIDLEGLRFLGVPRMEIAMANCARLAEGVRAAGKLNRATFFAFMCAYIRARNRADRNGP